MKPTIRLSLSEAPANRLNTAYIQAALDACRDHNGGKVQIGPGQWHIGSLRLYTNTTLHLLDGAHLIASDRYEDYEDFGFESTLGYLKSPHLVKLWQLPKDYVKSPITAVEAENISVIGDGDASIDGQDCLNENGEEGFRGPMGMVFSKCKNITLRGYTYTRSANWAHQLDSCHGVHMESVRVLGGHDAINIHHCKNVLIENCDFRTGDDCVAGYDAENVTVRNCTLNTACNSFRMGAKNLLVENCRFWGPAEYPHRSSGRHNTLFAFNYYAMEYDTCDDSSNWVIRNCTMENIDSFMHYNHGNCWDHDARPLHDITLENVTMTGLLNGSRIKSITPLAVNLRHVQVSFRNQLPEGGVIDTSQQVTFSLQDLQVQGL